MKMLIAVKNKFIVLFIMIFGTLSFLTGRSLTQCVRCVLTVLTSKYRSTASNGTYSSLPWRQQVSVTSASLRSHAIGRQLT